MGLFGSGGLRSWFPGFPFLSRSGASNGGPRRRPKPLQSSIRWVPVQLDDRELETDRRRPHELFVSQEALRRARHHLTGSGEEFGFLLGQRYSCRGTDTPWIHIAEAVPASTPFPAGGEVDRFRLACISAKAQAAARGMEVIGWYHEHRHLGPTLTDQDHELHGECFPSPWQCALVFVSAGRAPLGAFIQPWRGERFFQRAVVSFQEVVDGAKKLEGDAPSCIDWANYAPERPVRRERPLRRGNGRPATSRAEAPPSPADPKPRETSRRRPADPQPRETSRRRPADPAAPRFRPEPPASRTDASLPAAAAPPPSAAAAPPAVDTTPSAAESPSSRQIDPQNLGSRRRVFTPPRMPGSRPQTSAPPRKVRIDDEHFLLLPPDEHRPLVHRLATMLRRLLR